MYQNLNRIQSSFSIKDLEIFSGVKAHTLRVWESRYGIFNPERSEGNQRIYSTEDLKRLLSVILLYNQGHRISQIALLDDAQCLELGQMKLQSNEPFDAAQTGLELAILDLDNKKCEDWYQGLRESHSVSTIYEEVFVPLLSKIGYLWQSSVLSPVYEHFFSSWVIFKLNIETEQIQQKNFDEQPAFFLFLPEGEFHEIGLLFLHYKLQLLGKRSIYLGASLSINDVKPLVNKFSKVVFACHLTLARDVDELKKYIAAFDDENLINDSSSLWLLGKPLSPSDQNELNPQIVYTSELNAIEADVNLIAP